MKIVHSDQAPAAIGPYSQAVSHNGILYCSGQIALGADGSDHTKAPVQDQTRLALENLSGIRSRRFFIGACFEGWYIFGRYE